MRTFMVRATPWLITIALIAAAWVVVKFTPPDDAAQQPFVTTVEIGERGVGRNIDARVTDIRAAHTVTNDATGWSADGTWIIIDLEIAAVQTQSSALFYGAFLVIGDTTYGATERTETLRGASLVPGVRRSGSLAFEIPATAMHGNGALNLSVALDPRVDSVISVQVDLDALPLEDSVSLAPSGWASE